MIWAKTPPTSRLVNCLDKQQKSNIELKPYLWVCTGTFRSNIITSQQHFKRQKKPRKHLSPMALLTFSLPYQRVGHTLGEAGTHLSLAARGWQGVTLGKEKPGSQSPLVLPGLCTTSSATTSDGGQRCECGIQKITLMCNVIQEDGRKSRVTLC